MNSLSEFPESLPVNISKNELKCYECFRNILYVFFKILSYFLLSAFFLPLLVFLWLKSCFAKDTLRSNSLSRDWMERGPSQIFVCIHSVHLCYECHWSLEVLRSIQKYSRYCGQLKNWKWVARPFGHIIYFLRLMWIYLKKIFLLP